MSKMFKKKSNRDFSEGYLKRTIEDVLNSVGSFQDVANRQNVTISRLNHYV